MKRSEFYVLGAPDPEMSEIDRLVNLHRRPRIFASVDCERVHPANAYQATEPQRGSTDRDDAVFVECRVIGVEDCVIIDHHRPGDPGYGRPPEDYWEASSLGQVCARLGVEPDKRLRIIAAADHCLAAAYRGQCPGVDPNELAEWRIQSRAEYQRKNPSILRQQIEAAKALLRKAPSAVIGGVRVADMTHMGHVPELPEAAALTGIPFIAKTKDRGGLDKIVIQAAPPEAVEAFIQSWAQALGLTNVYGDPMRGFAGGFVNPTTKEEKNA